MRCFKRFTSWVGGTLLPFPVIATALFGGPIEGSVVEDGTDAAVPDALVVIRWEPSGRTGRRNPCFHVESAVTDARGTFRAPAWEHTSVAGEGVEPVIVPHKAGYRWSRAFFRTGTTRYLKPVSDQHEARLNYLWRIHRATDCHGGGESQKNLLPFKRALYEEARGIAVTPEEQEMVERLRADVEALERAYGVKSANHGDQGASQ